MIEQGGISEAAQAGISGAAAVCDTEILNIQNLGRDNGVELASLGVAIEAPQPESSNTPESEQAAEATPSSDPPVDLEYGYDQLIIDYPEGRGTFNGKPGRFEHIVSVSGLRKVLFVPDDGTDKFRVTE